MSTHSTPCSISFIVEDLTSEQVYSGLIDSFKEGSEGLCEGRERQAPYEKERA